ncbi:MAG: DotU family type IV/VI secretion system protein [Polyangiales bacterium]
MDRITWVTKDCFNAVQQLRLLEGSYEVAPAHVHARIKSFVDAMIQSAQRAGYPQEDVMAITYAVCALVDEVVLTRPGPLRDHWVLQPLQLIYFQDNLAGENFFHHLESFRHDPRRVDAVRVYYLALLFGFQGRYRVRGAEVALADYVESVRRDLAHHLPPPDVLSPEGQRPDELLVRVGRKVPVVALSFVFVALAVLLYVGMYFSLDQAMNEMLTWMAAFTRG